jgi:hypothetical protein
MNLIERAKNIIIKPKEEWVVVEQETTSVQELVISYLVPLALIPAIASFIRWGVIGYGSFIGASMSWGIKYALISFVTTIGGVYLSAFIIDALAPNFGSQKDFRKAMQLVVYSYTPMLIAGIFQIIPGLSFLSIVGLYGLYLLYIGIAPLMKTPEDKVTGFFVVSLVVLIVIYAILGALLSAIIFGGSVAGSFLK